MRRLAPLIGLVLLACAEPPIIGAVPDPCPPSAAAALEPRPSGPVLTDDQEIALIGGGMGVLGEALFIAWDGARIAADAWASRQAERIEQTRRWCEAR